MKGLTPEEEANYLVNNGDIVEVYDHPDRQKTEFFILDSNGERSSIERKSCPDLFLHPFEVKKHQVIPELETESAGPRAESTQQSLIHVQSSAEMSIPSTNAAGSNSLSAMNNNAPVTVSTEATATLSIGAGDTVTSLSQSVNSELPTEEVTLASSTIHETTASAVAPAISVPVLALAPVTLEAPVVSEDSLTAQFHAAIVQEQGGSKLAPIIAERSRPPTSKPQFTVGTVTQLKNRSFLEDSSSEEEEDEDDDDDDDDETSGSEQSGSDTEKNQERNSKASVAPNIVPNAPAAPTTIVNKSISFPGII